MLPASFVAKTKTRLSPSLSAARLSLGQHKHAARPRNEIISALDTFVGRKPNYHHHAMALPLACLALAAWKPNTADTCEIHPRFRFSGPLGHLPALSLAASRRLAGPA